MSSIQVKSSSVVEKTEIGNANGIASLDENGKIKASQLPEGSGIYADFEGSTTENNGTHGLVPAPNISEKENLLKGDGTWTNEYVKTTYNTISDGVNFKTASSNNETFTIRSANDILTVLVSNNSTYNDNVLLTLIPSNIKHSLLADLSNDDHPQYSKTDGSRPFTGNPSCSLLPSASTHLVNKTYADNIISSNNVMFFKGEIDCSSSPLFPSANKGESYKVVNSGKIGGINGIDVEENDVIMCIINESITGNSALVGDNWLIIRKNITADIVGLGNVTNDAQVKRSEMGVAEGVATLDSSNIVLQQPSQHFSRHALNAVDSIATIIASMPSHFSREAQLSTKTVSTSVDRYTLAFSTTWKNIGVNINDVGFFSSNLSDFILSDTSIWDTNSTTYATAANRAGKDFYIYGVNTNNIFTLKISVNATYPAGYTAANSRKLGGFHCLCANVGTISGHTLSGYVAGDILPASVWDLLHRPVCTPEGMVYVSGIGRWVDIYLSSVSGGALVSAYGGTIADGGSTPVFHWYKFSQWLGQIGKRLPTQHEFVAASLGSNQGTNITGSADPGITGGHSDTAGRRMISNAGCEDCCGALWQWTCEPGGPYAAAAWVNAFGANESGVAGQSYEAPNRALVGGGWRRGAACGSRGSRWDSGPLSLDASRGARGVAEPLAVAQ